MRKDSTTMHKLIQRWNVCNESNERTSKRHKLNKSKIESSKENQWEYQTVRFNGIVQLQQVILFSQRHKGNILMIVLHISHAQKFYSHTDSIERIIYGLS